jgi:hypothetical protein
MISWVNMEIKKNMRHGDMGIYGLIYGLYSERIGWAIPVPIPTWKMSESFGHGAICKATENDGKSWDLSLI